MQKEIEEDAFVNWMDKIIIGSKSNILYEPSDEIQILLMKQIKDKYLSIKLESPVEQTVDAGQLEKIIGDALEKGNDYAISTESWGSIWDDYKAQHIKQAIEQLKNKD